MKEFTRSTQSFHTPFPAGEQDGKTGKDAAVPMGGASSQGEDVKRIIIIEDEESIADTVIHAVKREGFEAAWYSLGREGLDAIRAEGCDLVVLDVGLPDASGFELCKDIRAFSQVPVIFLTARDDEVDKIVGLEIGGDDYVTKPFSPRELGARIKSVLRRADATPPVPAGEDGGLAILEDKLAASYNGMRLDLTRYEFRLLALLARHPGRVYTRDDIMREVWGDDSESLDRTVDTHIKSLRAKFRESADVDPVVTHRGVGYALKEQL